MYVVVSEIFSIKDRCDLENDVRGRSGWLKMASFYRRITAFVTILYHIRVNLSNYGQRRRSGGTGGSGPPNQDPQSYTARNDGDDGTVHITSCHLTHSLTHSLVNLPRWGLATAEDHSDIFLLHCARSCEIFSWIYSQPVHSSMLCIHCLLSLPWCRNPSMIFSRTVSANCQEEEIICRSDV